MEKETPPKGEIVIYTSADGKISLDAKLENETIWLTQDMMAKLFETTPQNITMHIKTSMKMRNWNKIQLVRISYKFEMKENERFREN